MKLKICDFGISREKANTMTSQQGTRGYMAPEVIKVCKSLFGFECSEYGILKGSHTGAKIYFEKNCICLHLGIISFGILS